VDWKIAGWFPEYWEYTRAWESSIFDPDWRAYLGDSLDVCEEELRVELARLEFMGYSGTSRYVG